MERLRARVWVYVWVYRAFVLAVVGYGAWDLLTTDWVAIWDFYASHRLVLAILLLSVLLAFLGAVTAHCMGVVIRAPRLPRPIWMGASVLAMVLGGLMTVKAALLLVMQPETEIEAIVEQASKIRSLYIAALLAGLTVALVGLVSLLAVIRRLRQEDRPSDG